MQKSTPFHDHNAMTALQQLMLRPLRMNVVGNPPPLLALLLAVCPAGWGYQHTPWPFAQAMASIQLSKTLLPHCRGSTAAATAAVHTAAAAPSYHPVHAANAAAAAASLLWQQAGL
jgi:hypothetical protein